MSKEFKMEEWCNSFKSAKLWLNAVHTDKSGSIHTHKAYCKALKTFSDWIGKDPDQLIAERRTEIKNDETEMNAENKLREFCLWLETELMKGKKEGTGNVKRTIVCKYHAPLKSFYSYNNLPLKLKTPKFLMREREPHKTEEIKALLQIANVRDRAFIMLLKDTGMSREDILSLTYGDIQKDYEANKDFILVKVVRQKEMIEYHTLLGPNAVNALRPYLDLRARQGQKITKDTPLMSMMNGDFMTPENFSMMFQRLSKKAGFMTSPHRFRKFFESHMGLSAPSVMVKYWMGHSLGVEKHYFRPEPQDQLRKYKEAYKEIDMEKRELNEFESRKQQFNDLAAMMLATGQINQEKYEGIVNSLKKVTKMQELEYGIKNEMRFFKPKKECNDGDCQKIIAEEALESYLGNGWHVVATLPSGKIVVSNE